MRILHINPVYGFGSTGRNTEELVFFLNSKGHENFVAFAHGKSNYENSYKYGAWVERKWHAVYFRLFGKQGLKSTYGTKKLIKYIEKIKPDIIHLNNVHGNHINFPMLFSFLAENKFPVVWTLHDCWAFTGVCFHYTAAQCYKWKTECSKVCPHHQAWIPDFGTDRVKEMFKLKKQYFTSLEKMIIVPVSQWLEDEAKQSFLSKYPVQHIYNWVDTKKFKPVVSNIRESYGIPPGKDIMLGVGANWSKDSTKYRDAISLADQLPDDICMVMVGSLAKGTTLPRHIVHIPYVHDTDELAKIYSAAMVYVHFSVEDTFGKVVAESMACGTPVIVFNSTALPELVGEGCGFIAKPHDIDEVLKNLIKIKTSGKAHFSGKCISRVDGLFNAETNMTKYLQVYHKLLSYGY